MGVPIEDWIATVQKYPTKYKFEGLDGFHTSIQEAYANDETALRTLIEDRETYDREKLDKILDEGADEECEELERYAHYLGYQVPVSKLSKENLLAIANLTEESDVKEEDYRKAIKILEDALSTGDAEHHRYMFTACDQWDWTHEQEFMKDAETEWLLEQYPLAEVYTAAGEYGIAADDVVFICPSCNQEPHSLSTLEDMGGEFHCGLCGASYLPDSEDKEDLTDEANLKTFAEYFDLKLYPFRQPEEAVCPDKSE